MSPSKGASAESISNDGFCHNTRISEELGNKLRRRRFMSEGDHNRHCFISGRELPLGTAQAAVKEAEEVGGNVVESQDPVGKELDLGGSRSVSSDESKSQEPVLTGDKRGRALGSRATAPLQAGGKPSEEESKVPEGTETVGSASTAAQPSPTHAEFCTPEAGNKHAGVGMSGSSSRRLPVDKPTVQRRCCSVAKVAVITISIALLATIALHSGAHADFQLHRQLIETWVADYLQDGPGGGSAPDPVAPVEPSAAPADVDAAHVLSNVDPVPPAEEFAGSSKCWTDGFTFDMCCSPTYGPGGNAACWDTVYNYQRCCAPR